MMPILFSGNQKNKNVLEIWYTGDGSATFDPSITTSQSTTIVWQTSDGHQATTTGTTHDFSYTPASGGPYRCTVRVVNGLGLVISMNISTDAVTLLKNIIRLIKCTSIRADTNAAISIRVAELPSGLTFASFISDPLITGDLSNLPRGLTYASFSLDPLITGDLSDLPRGLTVASFHSDPLITPGSIAHLTKINTLRLYSMEWTQANVDTVIASAWGARTTYTDSSIVMQIGGTNAAPSGNLIAPEEGSDWHNNGTKWIPLTGKAMVYDLLNDVNSEGFKKWLSISTN